jgi:hypothetical protein
MRILKICCSVRVFEEGETAKVKQACCCFLGTAEVCQLFM